MDKSLACLLTELAELVDKRNTAWYAYLNSGKDAHSDEFEFYSDAADNVRSCESDIAKELRRLISLGD